MHSLQLKLFLNLSDAEVAEVLENIQELQHIETFRELKKRCYIVTSLLFLINLIF